MTCWWFRLFEKPLRFVDHELVFAEGRSFSCQRAQLGFLGIARAIGRHCLLGRTDRNRQTANQGGIDLAVGWTMALITVDGIGRNDESSPCNLFARWTRLDKSPFQIEFQLSASLGGDGPVKWECRRVYRRIRRLPVPGRLFLWAVAGR